MTTKKATAKAEAEVPTDLFANRFSAVMQAINSLGVDSPLEGLAAEALKLYQEASLKDFATIITKTKAAMLYEPVNATTRLTATMDAIKALGLDAPIKDLALKSDEIYREARKCEPKLSAATNYMKHAVRILKLAAERGIVL